MFLEVELKSAYGSLPKPSEDDYRDAAKIIKRQVTVETGWVVLTSINKSDDTGNE